jgi:membrane associated rhomboid family serine protease
MQFSLKPATGVFAAIGLLIYLLCQWPGLMDVIVAGGGIIPFRFYGSGDELGTIATVIPAWLTPLTAPFINAGLISVVLSTLLLVLLGSMVEKILGWQGILALFAAGAIAGAATNVILTPESMQAITGASNTNSAVFAAYFILHPIVNTAPWGNFSAQQTKYIQLLLLWIIISLATGFPSDYVSLVQTVLAPVVSFAVGMFLAKPLLRWKYRNA